MYIPAQVGSRIYIGKAPVALTNMAYEESRASAIIQRTGIEQRRRLMAMARESQFRVDDVLVKQRRDRNRDKGEGECEGG